MCAAGGCERKCSRARKAKTTTVRDDERGENRKETKNKKQREKHEREKNEIETSHANIVLYIHMRTRMILFIAVMNFT